MNEDKTNTAPDPAPAPAESKSDAMDRRISEMAESDLRHAVATMRMMNEAFRIIIR